MQRVPLIESSGSELAEIKALTYELGKSTQLVLTRIREARRLLAANGALLAFVHIPKTAGGTATSMLTAAYSKTEILKTGNYVRNPEKTERKISSSLRREGQVSAGHTPYGALREQLPPDTRYMTFLREPVDRVLSHYYRHIHRPDMSPADRVERREEGRATAGSLEEALAEPPLPQLSNLATRFLCGHPSPMVELPASALDDAKANLREFAFVGIQERFEESIVLLQRMLGLGLVPYLNRHVSVEGGRPAIEDLPDDQRVLITEHNRLDAELYRFALGLFDDAVAASDDEFAADVQKIRTLSADTNEEAIQQASAWLDREFPTGTTRPAETLRLAAKEAGVRIPALKHLLGLLPIKTERDGDGQKILIRTEETDDDRIGRLEEPDQDGYGVPGRQARALPD